jgi:CheY-like chemotaxis protein
MPETILIVEDEAHVAGLLSDVLQAAGYEAVLTTGSRAVERAREVMPAAIVLDYLMPGLNGAEVVNQIRTSMVGDAPPMLLVTGLSNARELAEQGGFEGFLRKPFDVDTFVELVGDLIAGASAA